MIYIYDINRDDYENDYYINSENYDVIQFETNLWTVKWEKYE